MTWIRSVPDDEAQGRLAELYAAASDPSSGKLDEILRVHSLHPAGLEAHLTLYSAVMRGTRSLPKVERELIAFVVSRINACHY